MYEIEEEKLKACCRKCYELCSSNVLIVSYDIINNMCGIRHKFGSWFVGVNLEDAMNKFLGDVSVDCEPKPRLKPEYNPIDERLSAIGNAKHFTSSNKSLHISLNLDKIYVDHEGCDSLEESIQWAEDYYIDYLTSTLGNIKKVLRQLREIEIEEDAFGE